MSFVFQYGVNWSACGLGFAFQWHEGWSVEIVIGPFMFYFGDKDRCW
jgi:hypothetical protein